MQVQVQPVAVAQPVAEQVAQPTQQAIAVEPKKPAQDDDDDHQQPDEDYEDEPAKPFINPLWDDRTQMLARRGIPIIKPVFRQ